MIRTALLFSSVALLALAACAKPAPAPEPTASEAVPTDSSAAPIVAETSESDAPEAAIPTAAQGRWGLVPADCTSTRGDAKGLLTIDGTTLKFYESRGTLGKVAERSDTRIRASFAFSGEGMTWDRDEVLEVQDGGKTLVRRESGEGAEPGPFKYARCPT